MTNDSIKPAYRDVHALRPGVMEADDEKIRRILAVVDDIADPGVNRALLDPLRPRLAVLRPARPLRATRLLFIPLEPLMVMLEDWRPDDPAIPRPIMAQIAQIVRGEPGGLAAEIDEMIAVDRDNPLRAISRAGTVLWPRAAEIIATASMPADWAETGLPPSAFSPLVAAIAAVLRRATRLRRLARDQEIGMAEPNADAVNAILHDLTEEPAVSRTMIMRLILVRSPHAIPALRRTVSTHRDRQEQAALRQAIEHAIESVLAGMERATAFTDTIVRGGLADAGGEARRIAAVLREIETGAPSPAHRPRLAAIRAKLNDICRDRMTRGVEEGLVAPLAAAPGAVDGAGPGELESVARDLRRLDATARKSGVPAGYEVQMRQAADAVKAAAGTLSPMTYCRLIEIISGPDVAEAMYLRLAPKG